MIGTKLGTEAAELLRQLVGEHTVRSEASSARWRGPIGRDHAGMSSDKTGGKPVHRKPKVS
jgi:hypothetical protein